MTGAFHRLNAQQQEVRDNRAEEMVAQGMLQEVVAERLSMTRGALASMLQRSRRKREQQPESTPLPYPTQPCSICGCNEYWLREGWGPPKWECKCCHPEPSK